MFGKSVERKYRAYRTAVRWGVSCALAGMAASSAAVLTVYELTDRNASATTHQLWVLLPLTVVAIADAAADIFWIPRVVADSVESESACRWPGVFGEASRSGTAPDRAVARLGMTALVQLAGAFSPSVFGAVAYIMGAGMQVYALFVGFSVVVLAAVFPRLRDWEDAIAAERLSSLAT